MDLEDYEEEDMARLAVEKVAVSPLFVEMVPRRSPSWGLVGKEPEMIEMIENGKGPMFALLSPKDL